MLIRRLAVRATAQRTYVFPARHQKWGEYKGKPFGFMWNMFYGTAQHGAEIYLLGVYMAYALFAMLYQTCYATTFKKSEITTLPYMNKSHTYVCFYDF